MKWIRLFEEFQLGDLNFMSPKEIQKLFFEECDKKISDLNLIRVIVENGLVDVNSKDEWGMLPLHYTDSVAIAKYLISAGADVNAKNDYGNSPLHYAAKRDNVAIIKLLIKAGADVDAKNNDGRSPLHCTESVEVAKLLISAGADVNAKWDGKTPLHVAVRGGNIALAEYLIPAGADVNTKDRYGDSPLHMAVFWDNVEMEALLKKHGAVE